MKLSSALLLCTLATVPAILPAIGQTSSTTRSTTTRRTTTAAKPATPACPDLPVLAAAIPKVPGCPATLYALRYIDLVVGTGPIATNQKLFTVNYTGYLLDGTKFDSSVDRKDPIVFPYGFHRVIPGWDTGFEGMHVGGKRRLFIPYQLAYGEAGKPPTIPAKAELIFDVELIAVSDIPQQGPPQGGPPAGQPGAPPQQTRPATSPTTTPPAGTTPPPAPAPASAPQDPTKPTAVPPPSAPTGTTSPKP